MATETEIEEFVGLLEDGDLDAMVDDVAADVNNSGTRAQLEWLLHNGRSLDEIHDFVVNHPDNN